MKPSIWVLALLIALAPASLAQTAEKFDAVTFTPPVGWKRQVKDGAVIYVTSNDKAGTFCLLTIYQGGPSSGNGRKDFDTDWQGFVAGPLGVTETPEIETAKTAAGWESITGGAAFKGELGPSLVILNTFSGFGRSVSLMAVLNDKGYVPAIERFISSVKLEKPAVGTAAGEASWIVGTWGVGSSTQYAENPGLAGYIRKQYTFSPNGTYEFLQKNFQYTMTNLLFKKETGTYQISGDSLTLIPEKSYIQSWTKAGGTDKWGKLVSTQPSKLEKVTYQITRHYFSGIQEWQLVMQASTVTERDGAFAVSSSFSNSWLYGTQKYPIQPPQ